MEFDTKIIGGTLIDGTGAARFRGDLGISGGKITAMGKVNGSAASTIDAGGLMVSPGFVDVHTHYDAQILWDRMLSISPWHGVTTAVMGNCGFSVAPTRREHRLRIMQTLEKVEGMSLEVLQTGLGADWPFESFPEYLDAVENAGSAINVAALVGHTALRMNVMGEAAVEREATAEEISAMRRLVREAIDAGAIGFSTSASKTHVGYKGNPVPSRLASFEEVDALTGALAEAGRGILQATVGPGLFHDEFAKLYRSHGRPITWTALLTGFFGPDSHIEHLSKAMELREQGLDIVPQVACRPINFEFNFEEPFLFEALELFRPISRSDTGGKMRIYQDADFRERFKAKLSAEKKGPLCGWAERAEISYFPPEPALEERTVAHVARERGEDPVDLALDMSLQTRLQARFRLAVLNTDEDGVEKLIKAEGTLISLSDAGAHASQLCDACYSTHLLGYWVRERGAFEIEDAVHKLTQQPAELFGITGRGVLAPGMAADLVIFDAETIGASKLRRVNDLPAGAERLVADATGIKTVMVNGTAIRSDNRDLLDPQGPLPGRLLRNGAA